jgi:hypothetical protein
MTQEIQIDLTKEEVLAIKTRRRGLPTLGKYYKSFATNPEVWTTIKAFADRQGWSINQVITSILAMIIDEYELPRAEVKGGKANAE